jgi:hypothetical protein
MFHKAVLHLTFCLIIGVNVVFSAPNATTLASPTNGSEFGAQKVSVGNYYYYLCSPNPCQVYFKKLFHIYHFKNLFIYNQNGGYCTTNGYSFSCSCQYGFSGPYCQTC